MEYTPGTYLWNSDQRNVSVWASEVSSVGKPYMVAGCFVGPKNRVLIKVFYEWLDMIVRTKNITVYLLRLPDQFSETFLTPLRPTRDLGQEIAFLMRRLHLSNCLQHNSLDPVVPGDYMLFGWSNDRFHVLLPRLTAMESYTYHRSKPGTLSPDTISRNGKVRDQVRMRDLQCRISGQRCYYKRFEGMQVVQVFPLAWKNLVEGMCTHHPEAKDFLSVPENITSPANAFLLRADVRAYFNDYQFGVYGGKVYVFEEAGGRSFLGESGECELREPLSTKERDSDSDGALPYVPDVSSTVLDHHFRICLIWNVAGFGRGRSPNAIGGIIV